MKRWSGEEGDDAGCGSEKTSGVDPIDQGSAVGTDAQQLQRGGERTDRAALDAIRKRGCRETTSRERGVQGTGLCRCSPDGQEWDSGEARRRRGGVDAAAGAGRWCGRSRRGGCGQTVTHGGDGGAGARRGRGAAQRDRRAEQGQWQGGCGCVTYMARGEQGRTRGEHLGVGAGDASGGASGIWKWGGESARWQRGGGTGHGRREESREVAGVGWDGTGQAAHGEREQQRRGDRTGCARRVEAAARRDQTGVGARTRPGAQGWATRVHVLGRDRWRWRGWVCVGGERQMNSGLVKSSISVGINAM
ncbi:hypothetical protein B0H14DRAFT_3623922 [Mycena olivaceomarginata]|nr:hypothetical protein B0H14DRAFT_3623922 [Mycena olivaceomarginata]